jgi:alpha-mannosidase
LNNSFRPTKVGQDSFGPSWSTHWFRVHIVIPEEMDGQRVLFQWKMGCEAMVWSPEGVPLQGLSK